LHHAPALLGTQHIIITIGVLFATRRRQHSRAASTLALLSLNPGFRVVKNGRTLFCHFDFESGVLNLRSINNWFKCSNLNTKRCLFFDFLFDVHCPIHDPHPVEYENLGTNQQFLVNGVGSFHKGGGGSNWALTSLPERGVFRKFICEHQQEKRRRGTACSGHTQ
jgi:hypothetical protein